MKVHELLSDELLEKLNYKIPVKGKRPIKVFSFDGRGNYSFAHQWDDGLDTFLDEDDHGSSIYSTLLYLRENYEENVLNDFKTFLHSGGIVGGGVFELDFEQNCTNRTVNGLVIAKSRKEAKIFLKEYEEKFPYIPYER